MTIHSEDQRKFHDYDFKKIEREKIKTQKQLKNGGNVGDASEAVSKSKMFLSKNSSQVSLSSLLLKPATTTNNFLKKHRRNSQDKLVY